MPDADAQSLVLPTGRQPSPSPYQGATELTLVLACRNSERALQAKEKLRALLDKDIAQRPDDEHAAAFRKGLEIDCVPIDLCSAASVYALADHIYRW